MLIAKIADRIDRLVLAALVGSPRASTLTLSQTTGLARNTVRAHLSAFDRDGALLGFEQRIDPAFLGYPLRAYVLTRVAQRALDAVGMHLAEVPEVTEVTGVAGGTDLMVHIVARDADDLYRIAGLILAIDGVRRTKTSIVMRELVPRRTAQLIGAPDGRPR